MSSHFVSPEWLNSNLNDPSIVVVDCRFNLANPDEGMTRYNEAHIPGAVYFDLNKDMSSPVQEHGGRHPLPDMKQFETKLRQAGITSSTTVVAYDDQDGGMAARCWWLFNYVGHSKVFILDGGFRAWVRSNLPTTNVVPQIESSQFTVDIQHQMIIPMKAVKEQMTKHEGIVIDSRDPKRYRGDMEPIDKKAGHIPGAVNYFWKDNLVDGLWLSTEEMAKRFSDIPKNQQVTVYCGSGVTACANLIAMSEAGFSDVKLYPGSWSDWISYEDNPIETES